MSPKTAILTWYQQKVTERNLLGQILRKMRRFYLGTFRQDYIQQAIAETREGECHRCGLCCELIYKCPFLGRDSTNLPYCRVYGELRPANCRNYPFDRVDAEIDQCGYTFKPKVIKISSDFQGETQKQSSVQGASQKASLTQESLSAPERREPRRAAAYFKWLPFFSKESLRR